MLKSTITKWGIVFASIFFAAGVFAQKDLVISGGNTVSSFVCENKTAFVWGSNAAHQLGIYDPLTGVAITTDPITKPTPITKFFGVASAPDVKQINSGSGSHFVVLACSGDVWAWGVNGSGQIGIGTSGGIVDIPNRVIANPAVAATNRGAGNVLINASVVYSGTVNTFAILNDKRLVSWGGNSGAQAGQLGQGTTTDTYTANYVLTGPGTPLTGVIQIFAGDNVAYALADPDGDGIGTMYSWGNGLNGTLGRNAAGTGNPSTVATPDFSTVQDSYARPVFYVDDTPMNNIAQIQAGDVFGIALDVDGYVWTWGNGAWNNATGNTTVNYQGADPRRVIAGTTTGASNDGTYLLAKAIGGGQGYGMAVTIDSKPVAWGGTGICANGGMTGVGNTTAAIPPTYIQYAPGLVHNNVTLINRGDTWGFYGTSDNDFYAWGCNNFGQLGIGNTTDQVRATKITPPTGCSFRDPAPFADLKQDDISVCKTTFEAGPGLVLNSGFTILPSIASKYTVSWYKRTLPAVAPGTLIKSGPASVASNLTYTATQEGTYRVEISYTGANAGCVVFDVAFDEMTITYFKQNFTVPTPLTYCAPTIKPYVNGLGNYDWYKNPTGGTSLATTQKSNKATIATSAVNAPVAGEITVYVQESGQYVGNIAKLTPTNCTSITDKDNYNPVNSIFTLTNTPTAVIDTISFYVKNDGASYANVQLVISGTKLSNGHLIADNTAILKTTTAITVTTVGTTGYSLVKVPVNYTLTGPAGTSYAIGFKNNSVNGFKVANFDCNRVGTTDDIATGGPYLTSTGSESNGNWVNGFGSISNILFHTPMGFCERVPVKLTEACPCTKPTVVTITTPAAATVTLCQGTAQTLSGTVTVTAAAQNTAFTYSWRKVGTATPLQTGTIALVANTAKAVPDYIGITGTLTNAGKYILRVEDGNTNSPSCFLDDTLTLVVNATTVPGVIATSQTICTGGNPAAFTVTTAASGGDGTTYTYQWESDITTTGTYVAISGATNTTYDEGVLTNTGTTAKVISYRRKVTSGACPQVTSNVITITVNPAVVAGAVAADQTICSGGDPAAFTQTTAATGGSGTYTYVWQSSTTSATAGFTNITPAATNATYDAPTGLAVTTYYRRVDGSGTCTAANTAAVTVTIATPLVAGAVAADQIICYNTAPVAFTSTTAASGGTGTYAYQWQSSPDVSPRVWTDIATATNATYTDATLLVADKYYRRKVTSGTVTPCNVAYTAEIHVTVSPNFVVGSIGAAQTICSGTAPTALASVSLPTGGKTPYTYKWQSSPDGTAGSWTDVATGGTGTGYAPGNLTADTYYRRTDISAGGCGTLYTASIKITVDPVVTQATITADQAICSGASPSLIGGPVAAGGSTTATASYVWEQSTNSGGAWSVIATQVLKDYQPPALTAETWYRRTDKKGTCAGVVSTIVKITIVAVAPATVTLSQTPTGAICAGTSVTFTASAGNGGTPTYEWFIGASSQGAASTTANTFTSAALVNGDVVKVTIISSLSCANPKTASASSTMVVNAVPAPSVSVAADKTELCPSETIVYTATPTLGGTLPKYVWKNNGSPISGATNATYSALGSAIGTPNSITVEMISNEVCAPTTAVASTPVVVTVNPVLAPSVLISAATTPATTPTTICKNGSVTFTAAPTNPGSTPSYEWFINNVSKQVGTSLTFTTTELIVSSDVVKVVLTSNAKCASPTTASASMTIVVNAGIGSGTIGTIQTICYGTTPAALTETVAPTSIVGIPTYKWESSSDNGGTDPYTTISGATQKDYTPTGTLTSDIYYRRVITDPGTPAPCNVATSNAIKIKVNPELVAGTIGTNETTCEGKPTSPMSELTAPTGGTGTYTYQWQSSPDNGLPTAFTNINNQVAATYNAGNLTSTMYYRRVETSGTCGSVTSNVVTKTVTPAAVLSVSINNIPTQVCTGTTLVFTATGSSTETGTLSYEWFIGSTSKQTGPSSTFSYSPVSINDNGKNVTVVVTTSNTCNTGAKTSAPYKLDITDALKPEISIVASANPQCEGYPVVFTATATGGGNNPSYQWYVIPVGGSAPGNPVGNGTLTYTSTTLSKGDQVYVELTSDLPCLIGSNPFPSTKILMDIKPIPAPIIVESAQTICSPNSFVFHATVGTGTTLQWYRNNLPIIGATNASYPASESGDYSIGEDNGICNTTSLSVKLTVVQTPIAYAGEDIYIKEGDIGYLNGSGGAMYSWSPATYLNDASISTPSFKATQTINYVLTVSDASGTCSTTDNVTVFVVKPIKVPNVITVNGDGVNDDWEIENIEGYPNVIIEIYNRWGNLVWKTEGYPKNWDGTNFRNGEVLADGTYFYIINLESQVYNEPLTGWVQIVK